MIDLLIWSKDRACQLHLLLESIEKNMTGVFNIFAICKSSDNEFFAAYDLLTSAFPDVNFIVEQDFYKDTMSWIEKSNNYICFSTDDTVIYREPDYRFGHLRMNDWATFSLRLGLNTLLQNYHTNEYQHPLVKYNVKLGLHPFSDTPEPDEPILYWNFNHYHPHHNYGYPFGLDMHIYDSKLIKKLLKYQVFNNTNELESYLFGCKHLAPQYMASFIQSVAVNIPANNMSGVTIAGQDYAHTTTELNKAYLEGQRIDLSKIEQTEIIGCHQEIPLELK